eukprot:11322101-Alexandrium_andersonii.AAC.1
MARSAGWSVMNGTERRGTTRTTEHSKSGQGEVGRVNNPRKLKEGGARCGTGGTTRSGGER